MRCRYRHIIAKMPAATLSPQASLHLLKTCPHVTSILLYIASHGVWRAGVLAHSRAEAYIEPSLGRATAPLAFWEAGHQQACLWADTGSSRLSIRASHESCGSADEY